ncbi:hypothetical protein NKG05_10500 [Oerskovia sp. M15]
MVLERRDASARHGLADADRNSADREAFAVGDRDERLARCQDIE